MHYMLMIDCMLLIRFSVFPCLIIRLQWHSNKHMSSADSYYINVFTFISWFTWVVPVEHFLIEKKLFSLFGRPNVV